MLLHYDPQNRELRVIVDEVRRIRDAVTNVRWAVSVGDRVAPGDSVGALEWNVTPDSELCAPAGCEGEVEFINRNVLSTGTGIAEPPAKVLLRLAATASGETGPDATHGG